MAKEQFQARLPDEFAEKIHEYREDKYMSKSEAVRALLRAGLDAETPDDPNEVEAAIDEATEEHQTEEPITDGGYWWISDHPWIEPLLSFGFRTSQVGIYALLTGIVGVMIPWTATNILGATLSVETAAIFLSVVYLATGTGLAMLGLSLLALLSLDYLMHPSEAPFSRYFYTEDDVQEVTA